MTMKMKLNDNVLFRQNSIKIMFHRDNFTSGAQSFFYSTLIEWRIICVHYAEGDYSLNCSAKLK